MSSHVKFGSIENFHNVYKSITRNGEYPEITFLSKIKLHGTNAGIRIDPDGTVTAQSRNNDLAEQSHNHGFALWVKENQSYWQSIKNEEYTIVVFGEWAGNGVQRNVAVSTLPRSFYVFSVWFLDGESIVSKYNNPNLIKSMLNHPRRELENGVFPDNLHVIPNHSEITIDFSSPEESLQIINNDVAEIDKEDPYILRMFGRSGHGEGLVFRSIDGQILFKVKGESHAVNKMGNPARIKSEIPSELVEFVNSLATDERLRQMLEGIDLVKSNTGVFIKAVIEDIRKEAKDEIEESVFTDKQINSQISHAAKVFYFKQIEGAATEQ